MSDWKKNKVVGIAAGIIGALAIIILIKIMTVKPKPSFKGNVLPTPANTPNIIK